MGKLSLLSASFIHIFYMSEKLKYIKPTDILVTILVNLIQALELAVLVSSFSYSLPFFFFFFFFTCAGSEGKKIEMNDLQNIVHSPHSHTVFVTYDKFVTVWKLKKKQVGFLTAIILPRGSTQAHVFGAT